MAILFRKRTGESLPALAFVGINSYHVVLQLSFPVPIFPVPIFLALAQGKSRSNEVKNAKNNKIRKMLYKKRTTKITRYSLITIINEISSVIHQIYAKGCYITLCIC